MGWGFVLGYGETGDQDPCSHNVYRQLAQNTASKLDPCAANLAQAYDTIMIRVF